MIKEAKMSNATKCCVRINFFFLVKHTSGLSNSLVSRTCRKSLGSRLIFIHLPDRRYSDMALCMSVHSCAPDFHPFSLVTFHWLSQFLTNYFFVLRGQTSLIGVHTGVFSKELLPFWFTWSILQFYFGTMYVGVQTGLFSKRVIPPFLMMLDNKQ